MPASRGRSSGPAVRFDELAFAEDISHATAPGRRVALDARGQLERDGVDVDTCCAAKRTAATERDSSAASSCICPLRAGRGAWSSRSRAIGQATPLCSRTWRSAWDIPASRGSRRRTRLPTNAFTQTSSVRPVEPSCFADASVKQPGSRKADCG